MTILALVAGNLIGLAWVVAFILAARKPRTDDPVYEIRRWEGQ